MDGNNCIWLDSLTTIPGGSCYKLPTQLEWETAYAANSSNSNFYWNSSDSAKSNAWYFENSGDSTHPFSCKKSNSKFIYDMAGNVSEWCDNWFDSSASPFNYPFGIDSGLTKPICGGSYLDSLPHLTSKVTNTITPITKSSHIGFRAILVKYPDIKDMLSESPTVLTQIYTAEHTYCAETGIYSDSIKELGLTIPNSKYFNYTVEISDSSGYNQKFIAKATLKTNLGEVPSGFYLRINENGQKATSNFIISNKYIPNWR